MDPTVSDGPATCTFNKFVDAYKKKISTAQLQEIGEIAVNKWWC